MTWKPPDAEGYAAGCQYTVGATAVKNMILASVADLVEHHGRRHMVDPDQGFWGWQVGNAYFMVLDHSEMGGSAKDPGRVMFNFETAQVTEEFGRMTAAGAVAIREPYQMDDGWIATLADPDGNYFQLVTPMGG